MKMIWTDIDTLLLIIIVCLIIFTLLAFLGIEMQNYRRKQKTAIRCSTDKDCKSGEYCGGGNQCVAGKEGKELGENCVKNSDCVVDDYCISGYCSKPTSSSISTELQNFNTCYIRTSTMVNCQTNQKKYLALSPNEDEFLWLDTTNVVFSYDEWNNNLYWNYETDKAVHFEKKVVGINKEGTLVPAAIPSSFTISSVMGTGSKHIRDQYGNNISILLAKNNTKAFFKSSSFYQQPSYLSYKELMVDCFKINSF